MTLFIPVSKLPSVIKRTTMKPEKVRSSQSRAARSLDVSVRFVCLLVLGCWGAMEVIAQQEPLEWGCYVRYDYDDAGNRTDRYWYCWSNADPKSASALSDNRLRVGPVPASNELVVTLETDLADARLEVLDEKGTVISSERWSGTRATLPVERLAAGSYFVRVLSGRECIIRSFVVTH